ncbi:MAG: penicillin acylase family protein [Thermodesulfobacteriota bacterium]|nr:penicillin acylase family protein [Thermodesulfobacteriota bacterium]
MRFTRSFVLGITVILVSGIYGCTVLNNYQTKGTLKLADLKQPVEVIRDEKGMAYIRAGNLDDAITAQGFITAQDRLFQMEMIRMAAQGRISELMGEKARPFDIRMRTIGFYRNAQKHAQILNTETQEYIKNYIRGVNAYIDTRSKTRPLELKLAGIQPKPWAVPDVLSIIYYMSWGTSANLETEIIAQMLLEKIGPDRVQEILPLNINPDDVPDGASTAGTIEVPGKDHAKISLTPTGAVFNDPCRLNIGSNNWAVDASLSAGGKPIVTNDPHLEATILPGPWYPCGLITPTFRAVGVNIPGIPGFVVFRSDRIALGITNAYGDTQDLYLETPDPANAGRYMEGDKSLPFEMIEETLAIKDKKAPDGIRKESIKIRLTRRGPVVSKVLPGLVTDKIVTLRWSPFETMEPQMGLKKILMARSVDDARKALADTNLLMLNFVFADTMLNNWYFWQERLQRMVLENDSPWFDDQKTTDVTETRDDLFYRAAWNATKDLSGQMGSKPEKWLWGKIHHIEYLNPIRRKGIGKGVLGGGFHPVGGSGETLRRNFYAFKQPFDVIVSDSLRMVADLGDPEKVLAVLPGGVSGRTFHPHAKDQVDRFIEGEKVYWWFSDAAIRGHAETTLLLKP